MSARLPVRAICRAALLGTLSAALACGPAVDTAQESTSDAGSAVEADPSLNPGGMDPAGTDGSGTDGSGTLEPAPDGGGETGGSDGEPGTDPVDPGTSEPPAPPLFQGNFSGSASHSGSNILYALVYRAAGAQGHDHVVRSPNFSGELSYRVGDLSACSVSVTVPVSSLVNDEDAMRSELGWDTISSSDQADVGSKMKSDEQLDASRYPTIAFTSTACRGSPVASGTLLVDGNLTLHGVTRPVTWSVEFDATDSRVTAEGTLSILQSDYGIDPYSLNLVFVRFENADEVDLRFKIRVDD